MSVSSYKREIDGLRAIAVVAVVLYHAGVPGFAGGYVGVDMFFVISGYLITSLLLREWREHARINLAAFYARRVRRLLPALWLLIASVSLASMIVFPPMGSQLQGVLESALASLLFVANLYFEANSGGYFDGPAAEMPLLHLWSLSVEEQFYLVFPLMVIATLRCWRSRLMAVVAVGCLASLLLAEIGLQFRPSAAFYQMPARFWELAVGSLIAVRKPEHSRWSARLSGLGVALALAAVAMPFGDHFPGLGALPAVLAAGLVVYGSHNGGHLGVAGAVLRSPPMVAVGHISYSLYLWHWPLLAFDRALNVEESAIAYRLGLCALAVVLACISYRFIEQPFRRSSSNAKAGSVIWSAVAASGILAVGLLLIRPASSTSAAEELAWITESDQPENTRACHFRLGDDFTALRLRPCSSGLAGLPDVAIWGDSHALAWQPMAWAIAGEQHLTAISFTMDSCPPVDRFDVTRPDFPRHRDQCRTFNALVLNYLAQHRVKTLIVQGRWLRYFSTTSCDTVRDQAQKTRCGLEAGLEGALAKVAGRADEVILIVPTPVLRDSAPKCIATGQLDGCAVPRGEYDQSVAHARGRLMALASRYPNVIVVDPAEFFCDAIRCPLMKGRYALFWDDDHASSTAIRAFSKVYLGDRSQWQAWPPGTGKGSGAGPATASP